jgi:hypothetical protein
MLLFIKNIIFKTYNRFFLNKSEKSLIKSFTNLNKKNDSSKYVLISAQLDDNYFFIKNFIIGTYLSRYKKLSICYYINFHNLTSYTSIKRKIRNFFAYNYFGFLKMKKKYDSFCDEYLFNYYFIKPKKNYYDENNIEKIDIKEISKFCYKNIIIGDLCIDTYLQTFHSFLINEDLNKIKYDKKFKITFNTACALIDELFDEFKKKNITTFVTNYSGYLDHGIGLRVALFLNCKIFITGDLDKAFIISNDQYHKYNYSKIFKNFNKLENKNEKIIKAKSYLKKRSEGKKDPVLDYLSFLPYKKTKNKLLDFNLKKSVCIFAHYTADSLYGFRGTKFLTQKSWIEQTIKNLRYKHNLKKITIYFKIHPNESVQGEKYLRGILNNYKFVKVLDKNTNINQIINSNLIAGITMHGTIGLELAFNGIKTLYSSNNPYVNFDFCIYRKKKNDYFQDLKNITKFKKSKKHIKEASIFYYMNNFFSPDKRLKNLEILNLKKIFYIQDKSDEKFIYNYIKKLSLKKTYKKLNILEKCFDDGII